MTANETLRENAKRAAGIKAASMAQSGQVLGLGTGSTTAYAIEELGRRMREEGASFVGVTTSYSTDLLARRHGIPVRTLDDVSRIDLAIDGADEVDYHRCLIKGSGGAHTREKIIDYFADFFVVVVDETKVVERLGLATPVPVEVLPLALSSVMRRAQEAGGEPTLRMVQGRHGHTAPAITDQGNMVVDVRFPGIDDPRSLECRLKCIPGAVENGLFTERQPVVLVGSAKDGQVHQLE